MGAWGSGLYSNDTTCDVRDTYKEYLEKQCSNQEAYEKILDGFHEYMGIQDEEPLFWYALAETQWKVGRLMPEVKAKALEWIERGGGMTLWEESKSGSAGWKKTLEKLRSTLESEQPKERKFRRPVVLNKNLWNVGDVYAYQFYTEKSQQNGTCGKYMLIQKIGEGKWFGGEILMRIHVFDKLYDNLPKLEDLEGIRLLPLEPPHYYFSRDNKELRMNRLLGFYKKNEYPKAQLTYIGNRDVPENAVLNQYQRDMYYWSNVDGWGKLFQAWQKRDYETAGDGVFRYIPPK